jgi:hypothetical protein
MHLASIKQREIKATFSSEEDNKIRKFVQVNGYERIAELARQLPNRTAKQIRERYRLYLNPNVNHGKFSIEENSKLIQYVHKYGKKWSEIAKMMPERTDVQLKYKYRQLSQKDNFVQTQTTDPVTQQLQPFQAITLKSEDKALSQNQFLESTFNCQIRQKPNEEQFNFAKIDEELFAELPVFKTDSFEDWPDLEQFDSFFAVFNK